MKRFFSFLFLLVFLLGCCGCNTTNQEDDQKTVVFYYCTDIISYETDNGVIATEVRSTAYDSEDLKDLLDLYFEGPVNVNLVSPFPSGLIIEDITVSDNRVQVSLNSIFSELNGLDATLASICLVKTVQELTETDCVILSYENSVTGKRHNITFDHDSYLLSDNTVIDTDTEE